MRGNAKGMPMAEVRCKKLEVRSWRLWAVDNFL
jgi:hypothetical protein